MNEELSNLAEGLSKGLKDKIPSLYPDMLQPGAKEIGKGIAAIIKIALAPVAAAVWGYDKISNWLGKELENRLKDVPPENIISPDASVVGPAIEAMKFLGDKEELRKMFANLIACSLDKEKAGKVHPGLVEVMRNISEKDAEMLLVFKSERESYFLQTWLPSVEVLLHSTRYLTFDEVLPSFIETDLTLSISNLSRLGLIEVQTVPVNEIEAFVKEKFKNIPEDLFKQPSNFKITFVLLSYGLTKYGEHFVDTCIS